MKFGRLSIIKLLAPKRKKNRFEKMVLCLCDCGTKKKIELRALTRKRGTVSCGCLARERISAALKIRNFKHGMSEHRIYLIWHDMIRRCTDPSRRAYKNYGGRGIKVCRSWLNFKNFFKEMGLPPEGHSLDRINNDGPYSRKNCRWANIFQQANNRRNNRMLVFSGETLTMRQVSEKFKIPYSTLRSRIHRGWTVMEAINGK